MNIADDFALTAHQETTFDKFYSFLYGISLFDVLYEETIARLLGLLRVLHPVKDRIDFLTSDVE